MENGSSIQQDYVGTTNEPVNPLSLQLGSVVHAFASVLHSTSKSQLTRTYNAAGNRASEFTSGSRDSSGRKEGDADSDMHWWECKGL